MIALQRWGAWGAVALIVFELAWRILSPAPPENSPIAEEVSNDAADGAHPQHVVEAISVPVEGQAFQHAAQAGLELSTALERNAAMEKVAATWMSADPIGAMRWAGHLGNVIERERVQRVFIRAWAAVDAPAAAAFVSTAPEGKLRQQWIQALGTEWAARDLESAVTWAKGIADVRGRDSALHSMARVLLESKPELAVQLAMSISAPERFRESVRESVYQWSQMDPAAAVKWLREQPAGTLRMLATEAAFAGWVESNPVDAAVEVAQLPDAALRDRLTADAARRWAETSPSDAATWASESLQGSTRARVLEEIVPAWAEVDPNGLAEWLNSMGSGSQRDALVASLCSSIAESSPERAMEWASTIADNATLRARLEEVRDVWAEQDPEAARAWVVKSALSATLKSQLLAGE